MRVSIIIPVYGVTDYVERCIRSVIAQRYACIECIVVDDASPDDSIAKCEALIADYKGPISFKVLHHEKNRGLSAARNTGIDAATGDYVFFLDGDDELMEDCIENLIAPVLKDSSIEMVLGDHVRYVEGSSDPTSSPVSKVSLVEQDIHSLKAVREYYFKIKGYYGQAWNRLIKKEFLIGSHLYFKEGLKFEDNLWTFFVLKHLSHIYVVPVVTYHYFIRPHSITNEAGQKERDKHFGAIYETIANNLTAGEEGFGANIYVRGFCRYYNRNSKDYSYVKRSELFLKALKESHYDKEARMLKMVMKLSKTAVGRWAFEEVTRRMAKGR